jgi:hypothetical protein
MVDLLNFFFISNVLPNKCLSLKKWWSGDSSMRRLVERQLVDSLVGVTIGRLYTNWSMNKLVDYIQTGRLN